MCQCIWLRLCLISWHEILENIVYETEYQTYLFDWRARKARTRTKRHTHIQRHKRPRYDMKIMMIWMCFFLWPMAYVCKDYDTHETTTKLKIRKRKTPITHKNKNNANITQTKQTKSDRWLSTNIAPALSATSLHCPLETTQKIIIECINIDHKYRLCVYANRGRRLISGMRTHSKRTGRPSIYLGCLLLLLWLCAMSTIMIDSVDNLSRDLCVNHIHLSSPTPMQCSKGHSTKRVRFKCFPREAHSSLVYFVLWNLRNDDCRLHLVTT